LENKPSTEIVEVLREEQQAKKTVEIASTDKPHDIFVYLHVSVFVVIKNA